MASLIAPEYFNNHIAVEGEIIVKTVSNDKGFVLVWNPTTKKISQRTNAEIIADLNLITGSNENFFSNNNILARTVGNVATTLDAELPNGGFVSSYNTSGWGGADRPEGASYGGYIKFKGYSTDINNLDLYYNNGHDGTDPRLWFRTKEGINGVRKWSELLHTGNIDSVNLITNDQNPTDLYAKENKFGWINGAVTGAGGINSWVGNYLSIGGNNQAHKSQLLISKSQLLFRGNHGNDDSSFNEVYHSGNFNPAGFSPTNHSHQSLQSPEVGTVDADSLFEENKLKFSQKIDNDSIHMFSMTDNANSIVSIASHPGGYGVQLGFNGNEGSFVRNVSGGKFRDWKQFAYRDWVTAQINDQSQNFIPYNGATQNVNLGTKDLEFNDGGAISKRQNDVRVFNKVYQGYYDFGGHTGILALKMPQVSSEQTMFSIDINIYGYENKYLGKVNVAFYKYISGTLVTDGSKAIWEVTDNFPTTTARVGIGTDGYVSILLGEADTFWNGYLSFEVARVETKYGYYNLNWDTGWSHALETNFDLYNSNIIVLPSDVVATRSWLTNFANNNYIPRTVQPNDNFNSLGGNSTSGVYKADNDGGGVKYLKSTMLHLGAQEATSQLQVKHNDGSTTAGELAYRGGYLGNWTNWRVAWDSANFKPGEYQTRNTDEIISAAKSYYNRIPFKFKNGAYKSWAIQKPTNNGLVFVPSVTKNAEDWDFNNSVQFTDSGQVSSKGFNKTGSNDNYLLTGGGGHRLASDFVSPSVLENYVNLYDAQVIKAKKNFTQGVTVNTDQAGLPIVGDANNIPSKISSIDETYGMGMGIVSSGQGYIQQQRFDGTPHAYDLFLQPSGGNVVVGYNQTDYHNDKLQTNGRIVSRGNERNSVKTYVSVQNVDEIVAGHTLNWYNTSWKVGNMRGGSDDSRGYNFEFSTDGGATYKEKVRIHTDSNITTQNYGNAQQWNQAYQWGNHANGGYLGAWENASAIGFFGGSFDSGPYVYHKTGGYLALATQNWTAGGFVNIDRQQDITGLKIIKDRARNTGAGWGNTSVSTDYSFLVETKSGSNPDNQYTGSIGFFSNSGAQAGIYVRSNDENGTSMAFATSSLFSAGPQIAMTINNYGAVDHVRSRPTFQGNVIWDAGNLTPAMIGNWNNKFKDLKFVDDLNEVSESGIYRQEAPSSKFNYTTTLNLNSSDGRQQLTIERGGNGMKFRGSNFNAGQDWGDWRTVWSDLDFTQNNINQWNNALSLNNEFSQYTGSGLAVVDYYNGLLVSGLYNVNDGVSLAGIEGEYYKYSSTYEKWEGINFHRGSHNIGIGTEANDADKINVSGSVKAEGNFKSIAEDPNTLFIPNGELATLEDEITHEKNRMRLSHRMIEQDPNIWEYKSDNRMLVIRCTYPGQLFELKECFPGQRILVLNTHHKEAQSFRITSAKFEYRIPPYSSIQLFAWDENTVYKYAENEMWL